MAAYSFLLLLLSAACATLLRRHQTSLRSVPVTPELASLQRRFMAAYLVAVSADWVQGPYLYRLYAFYGFGKAEIGALFVASFASSMIFGTVAAGMADRLGRKKVCLGFCALYAASCLTMHSRKFEVLLTGRVLGGISTSILFSVFEAWMLHEHARAAYPDEWLVNTLGLMTFLSSVAAVGMALLANAASSFGGYTAPFDTAIVLLLLAAVLIARGWKENYGDASVAPGTSFAVGWILLAANPRIWMLGIAQSCFEGAMYIFVFSWTPVLEQSAGDEGLRHGVVFASFMVGIMIGSYLYQEALLLKKQTEWILMVNSAAAGLLLSVPIITSNHDIVLLAFCAFEVCVGVHFPGIAFLRSKYIPEEVRATVGNFFRIPLNGLVIIILLNIAHMSNVALSLWCAGMLASGTAVYNLLLGLERQSLPEKVLEP